VTIRAIALQLAVVVVAAIPSFGCSGGSSDDGDVAVPSGLYVSTCNPELTIEFTSETDVRVNRSTCHSYELIDLTWEMEGDELRILSPEGESWEVAFEITDDDVITLKERSVFIDCSSCLGGDTWEKQR